MSTMSLYLWSPSVIGVRKKLVPIDFPWFCICPVDMNVHPTC